MYELTEGALDKIMNGIEVDKPILQILGHKKLASSNNLERYRLLVSDGKRLNSFAMLATQLNEMVSNNSLIEYTICQINRYAMSMVNNAGKQKRVMVILSIDIKVPGEEVGCKIGDPTSEDSTDSKSGQSVQSVSSAPRAAPQKSSTSLPKQSIQSSSTNNISTTPIVGLSPYQNKWVIKVRVVSKSGIRTWSNSRGEGKLFSMDLVDETGEIRCTAFRDQVDKFYDMIEIGKIYYISRATLKTANKQFNHLKNEYEMTLTGDSEVIPHHESDDDSIPSLQFNFETIDKIETKQSNDIMDVLAIVKSSGDVQHLTSRNSGKELKKRDIEIIDESNTMVVLTLWGTDAEQFDSSNNPVVAIKGARVAEFGGGKTLSIFSSSVLQIDPDMPQAHRLRGWFNAGGRNEMVKSLSKTMGAGAVDMSGPFTTFAEAKKKELGFHGHAEMFTVKATVQLIRAENAIYKSCPSEGCKKKLIDQSNDMYRCEKCNKEYPNYRYRLLTHMSLADWSANQWVTAFSGEAEKILGLTGEELGELKENDNDAYLDKFSEAAFRSFVFKLRVTMEMFNDENRLRFTVAGVAPVDHKAYNKQLLSKISENSGIGRA
ncbi:replication protein A 70 kDa DNA-binding subunit [Ceratina calcarata]|uniref:Replication protein A subunit n=1 Tax=Ceratina calcarata TaxID=156304 RepID=A0AAJ7NCW8_9HYME|nr:replication protein A 70 kDa DNA-binding subunit [Ceratina calcarata]